MLATHKATPEHGNGNPIWIQDHCASTPAPPVLFLLPFPQGLFPTACLGLLPTRPAVTPLLQGASYSPSLNGFNSWPFRIMIHEATGGMNCSALRMPFTTAPCWPSHQSLPCAEGGHRPAARLCVCPCTALTLGTAGSCRKNPPKHSSWAKSHPPTTTSIPLSLAHMFHSDQGTRFNTPLLTAHYSDVFQAALA